MQQLNGISDHSNGVVSAPVDNAGPVSGLYKGTRVVCSSCYAGISQLPSLFSVIDHAVELSKRTVSVCLTYGLYGAFGVLSPFFDPASRPQLFGKPVSILRYATTGLWGIEPKGFHPKRVQVVKQDGVTKNIVVRSSLPLDERGKLVLNKILEGVNEELGRKGEGTLTEGDIELHHYPLINRIAEHSEWEQLRDQNDQIRINGIQTAFHPSPVTGTLMGVPSCLPRWLQNLYQTLLPYYLTWTNFPGLIERLQDELTSEAASKKRKVILVHCIHGIDRTGLVCGALCMKNGMSYVDARREAARFAETRDGYQDVDSFAHNGLQHYAHWLQAQGMGETLGDLNWEYRHKKSKPKPE